VLVECGDTSVLVTATRAKGREGIDFPPPHLRTTKSVSYARGASPPAASSAAKAAPPSAPFLTTRLIDRPSGPLFPSGLRGRPPGWSHCLSLDERVPPDVLAVTGASIAHPAGQNPLQRPMAGRAASALLGDDSCSPQLRRDERSELDLVVAGTRPGGGDGFEGGRQPAARTKT